MGDLWIVNASPVIALAGANLHELLTKLCSRLVVPQPVVSEILKGPATDPARNLVESGWGTRMSPVSIPPNIAAWSLGAGENSVLSLGLSHPGCEVVLDDAPARRCARSLGLPTRGTVGVLLFAKRRGLIPEVKEPLLRIQQAGFYVDDALLAEALRQAGE